MGASIAFITLSCLRCCMRANCLGFTSIGMSLEPFEKEIIAKSASERSPLFESSVR